MKKRILVILFAFWSFILLSARWVLDVLSSSLSVWWRGANEGLGSGITTPSFTLGIWGWVVGALLAVVGFLIVVRRLSKRPRLTGKPTTTVVPTKKTEEPKKKKDDDYRFFPFWLLMSFHWIGVLSCMFFGAYLIYRTFYPMTLGEGAFSETELKTMAYAAAGLPMLFHWINIVNGKKGERTFAFAVGWIVSFVGLATTLVGGYMLLVR